MEKPGASGSLLDGNQQQSVEARNLHQIAQTTCELAAIDLTKQSAAVLVDRANPPVSIEMAFGAVAPLRMSCYCLCDIFKSFAGGCATEIEHRQAIGGWSRL